MRSTVVRIGRVGTDHSFVCIWRALVAARPAVVLLAAGLPMLAACRADFVQRDKLVREVKTEPLADLRREAAAGDADAAFELGLRYDLGRGAPEDFAEAMRWYQLAARLGHATGAFNAGVLYDSGRGVPVNQQEALRWYRLAAQRGFGRADYALGLMYLHGDGVRRDVAQAKVHFAAAQRHGVEAARIQLARLTRPEDANGDAAFEQVQEQILARGFSGLDGETVKKLLAAAQKGNPLAQYDLGYCYENGIGLEVDRVAAYVWYSRSARAALPATAKAAAETGAQAMQALMTEDERRMAVGMLSPVVR